MTPAPANIQLPSNLRAAGLLLDPEHAHMAGELLRRVKNDTAISTLATWRRSLERLPFLVLAGELHKPRGAVIGGLAQDWTNAKALFCMASQRFDELAQARGRDFSAAWFMFLVEDRRQQIAEIAADAQQPAGSA